MKPQLHGCFSLVMILLLGCIAGGCSVNGTVTDFNRNKSDVVKLSLSGPGTLTVLGGDALLEIPIKKIRKIELQNDMTRIYNQELFCLAEVVLKDGSKVGSFSRESNRAYVAVNRYLSGTVGDASYTILLQNVSRVELNSK